MGRAEDITSAALDSLPVGAAIVDATGKVVATNEMLARALNRDAESLRGCDFTELSDDPASLRQALDTPSAAPGCQERICRLGTDSGTTLEMLVAAVPGAGKGDERLFMAVARDSARGGPASPSNEPGGRELAALTAAGDNVARATTLEDLAQAAIDGLNTIADCGKGVVAFYPRVEHQDAGKDQPRQTVFVHGLPPEVASELLAFAEQRLSSPTGALSAQPTAIPDAEAFLTSQGRDDLARLLASESLGGLVYCMMTARGETIGAIVAGSARKGSFTQGVVAAIAALATQVAAAAAYLLQSPRPDERSNIFWQHLLQVSLAINARRDISDILHLIADAAADALRPACAEVWLLDADRSQFQAPSSAAHRGLGTDERLRTALQRAAWETVSSGEIQAFAGDAAEGNTSFKGIIAAPLRVETQALGVLVIGLLHRPAPSARETRAVELLAAQAAVAISNLRLVEMANIRSRKLEAAAAQAWEEEARARTLFAAATAITEIPDLSQVLDQIASSAAREIGFERVHIYLIDQDTGRLEAKVEAHSDGQIEKQREDVSQAVWDIPFPQSALRSTPYIIYSVTGEVGTKAERFERLCVPLRTQAAVVGIMMAENPETGACIEPQQTRLLQSLATLAAVAIERARIDRIRSFLVSSVSHELRAPLSSIQAYNELILDGEAGPITEDQRVFLRRIDSACLRLRRVIDDLMDLSKLRAGEMKVTLEPSSVMGCIDQTIHTLSPRAADAQVDLIVDKATDLPVIMTDPLRYEQVITNLVENAIKYNYAGGSVWVKVAQENGCIVTSVTDTGPGIPEAEQSRIFDEFQRGADQLTRSREGAGLGLAIARRVAEYLGGTLSVESRAGQGSTFTFQLPAIRPDLPTREPNVDECDSSPEGGGYDRAESPGN
jgi:signal transduction histidine kinase